jgi:hypothetical protein
MENDDEKRGVVIMTRRFLRRGNPARPLVSGPAGTSPREEPMPTPPHWRRNRISLFSPFPASVAFMCTVSLYLFKRRYEWLLIRYCFLLAMQWCRVLGNVTHVAFQAAVVWQPSLM